MGAVLPLWLWGWQQQYCSSLCQPRSQKSWDGCKSTVANAVLPGICCSFKLFFVLGCTFAPSHAADSYPSKAGSTDTRQVALLLWAA